MTPTCPVCGGPGAVSDVKRDDVPVHQNVPKPTAAEARATRRGDLQLAHCPHCQFVWNARFDEAIPLYGDAYENDQSQSPRFSAHVDTLVDRVAELVGDGHVIEVGCGNGYFLRHLVERTGGTATGYDISYRGPAEELGGRLRFATSYYEGGETAQVVVCRHVVEHLPRPMDVIRVMRGAIADGGTTVIETPAVEWILAGGVYQDLFYEHCSYFSEPSLTTACRLAGLEPVVVRRVFGDQYLWVEATPAATTDAEPTPGPDMGPLVAAYGTLEHKRVVAMRALLSTWRQDGPVAVWGAGAKGVTFVNLLDPEGTMVDCVIDVNPAKQDRFIPGTGHPIVAPDALVGRGVRTAVVMNANYLEECASIVVAVAPGVRLTVEKP